MMEGFSRRAQNALKRKWVVFIRQSTAYQRKFNLGSGDVQAQQGRIIERMNVHPDQVITIDARGESGRAEVTRHHFEELIRLLQTGTVGVLVLARFDRLGRNTPDMQRALKLLAKHSGMLLIDGRIYDPKEPNDKLSLGVQSEIAEYENVARTRWMMLTRWTLATQLKSVIPVPVGLIWANPQDTIFRTRLLSAGLGGWLERPEKHRAVAGYAPATMNVLPFPDREVHAAARLRLDWLMETQDLAAVRARIHDPGSGWPRPGLVPLLRSSVYSPDLAPLWIPVEHTELGSWYRSPALYTIYSYTGRALAEADDLPIEAFTVYEPRAFPSFAEPEDLDRVAAFLSRSQSKPWKARSKAPVHLLPNVRCARLRKDGKTCGRHMIGVQSCGERRYKGNCSHRPHGSISHRIEEPVLEIILAAVRPEEIKSGVEALRRDRDAALARRSEAQVLWENLASSSKAALDLAIEAKAKGQVELANNFTARSQELTRQADEAERRLVNLRDEEGQIRAVTNTDYARVLALASDLPRLMEDARSSPDVLRKLVGELVRAVHVRPLAHGVVEVVVEFPTGERVRRVVETHPAMSSQPQRLYAAQRLSRGAAPQEVADELNAALDAVLRRISSMKRFTAPRVETLAAMHVHGGDTPPREGNGKDATALAIHYGVTPAVALETILLGDLGPASWTPTGSLAVVPTDEEAAWVFLEWARRTVAAQRGWPIADTLSMVEATDALHLPRAEVLRRAERCSGAVAMPGRRLWVRRSEVEDPDAALRTRLQELRPDLNPVWWVPLRDAAVLSGLSRTYVQLRHPTARPGYGTAGPKSVYVWLRPDGLPPRLQSLAAAVHALGTGYDVNDFVALSELAADLRRRFGVGGKYALRSAATDGRVVSVRAAREGRGARSALYIMIPPEVRNAACARDVLAWLGYPSHG